MQTKSRLLRMALFTLTGMVTRFGFAAETEGAPAPSQTLYPAGSQQSFKGPDEYFTGDVRVDMLFPGNITAHYSGAYVTFAPGARTAWHMHPAGQHMIVTKGTALTGTRDGRVIAFHEGDTVWCPSNIDHWHGATPDTAMTHLVITGSKDGENVTWKQKVSDKEYKEAINHMAIETPTLEALTLKQQRLVSIAAFTASGDLASLKVALKKGLDDGLTINEIKEAQIHLYAYVGFPRALNGLGTFMAVVEERKAKGIKDETGNAPAKPDPGKTSLESGKTVQTELVGHPVSGPLFDFAPDMNTLLQSHLFGDLFARGILDYQSREIVTVSALSAIDGVDSQLMSHIGIASNVGVSEEQLSELATIIERTAGKTAGTRTEQAIKQVLHSKSARQ